MHGRLAKLASVSAALRSGVEKRAFVGKVLNAVGAVGAAGAAVGKAKQIKAGFDPAAQQAAIGTLPNSQ